MVDYCRLQLSMCDIVTQILTRSWVNKNQRQLTNQTNWVSILSLNQIYKKENTFAWYRPNSSFIRYNFIWLSPIWPVRDVDVLLWAESGGNPSPWVRSRSVLACPLWTGAQTARNGEPDNKRIINKVPALSVNTLKKAGVNPGILHGYSIQDANCIHSRHFITCCYLLALKANYCTWKLLNNQSINRHSCKTKLQFSVYAFIPTTFWHWQGRSMEIKENSQIIIQLSLPFNNIIRVLNLDTH
jgi:hypothetical protein